MSPLQFTLTEWRLSGRLVPTVGSAMLGASERLHCGDQSPLLCTHCVPRSQLSPPRPAPAGPREGCDGPSGFVRTTPGPTTLGPGGQSKALLA